MPYLFSQVATKELPVEKRCLEDRRLNPVRGRKTLFRLLQQNMLAYTFDSFVPGFAESTVLNDTPFAEVVQKPIDNAAAEGKLLFGDDFDISDNASRKVAGDIFEVVTHARPLEHGSSLERLHGRWPVEVPATLSTAECQA